MSDGVRVYLDGVRERLAKITSGEWRPAVDPSSGAGWPTIVEDSSGRGVCYDVLHGPDTVFIAAAPSDVRALSAAVEAVLDICDRNERPVRPDAIRRAVAAYLDPKENPNG